MGKMSSGAKAGLIGGLLVGIVAGAKTYLQMTFFKEEYMRILRETLEEAFEKYGAQLPSGMSLDQLVEMSYNTGRIWGSVGAVIVFTIIGVIIGLVYALIYNKLPMKSPIFKALTLTLAIYIIWTVISETLAFGMGFPKPKTLPQWFIISGYIIGFVEYVLLGIIIGALHYKWYVSVAE
ncbi:MAG: hypothetical protein DRO23_11430 [Thermoprotei archaeon]|nr:MAG: hypothetical protein DRO23_11430 [Thermoprotei archaeon]